MISDEERREVAAGLVSEAHAWMDAFPYEVCDLGDVSAVMQDLCAFAGLRGDVLCGEIFRRFAELIDRPTGIATKAADGYAVCRTCGANFIVSVPAAFRCEEESEADYCPFCGTPLDWRHEDD